MGKKRFGFLVLVFFGLLYLAVLAYDSIDSSVESYSEEVVTEMAMETSPDESMGENLLDMIINDIATHLPFVFVLCLAAYVFYLALKELKQFGKSSKKSGYIEY